MKNNSNLRKFEIPYNFDKQLILGLQLINMNINEIACIYLPPYWEDYQAVDRNRNAELRKMTREEYADHVNFIESKYPNKVQLLLQDTKRKQFLTEEQLEFYINLGFKNFCCGTYEQAKLIKSINSNFIIVGSIAMHIQKEDLYGHPEYRGIFDYFVLDFSYTKNIQKIKYLPSYYQYMILANSLCNCECDGTHHWELPEDALNKCPGLITDVGWERSCLIRPMDLKYFDPYIAVYKIQDRGWPTHMILRDVVLYTTNFDTYPGIDYDEDRYESFYE